MSQQPSSETQDYENARNSKKTSEIIKSIPQAHQSNGEHATKSICFILHRTKRMCTSVNLGDFHIDIFYLLPVPLPVQALDFRGWATTNILNISALAAKDVIRLICLYSCLLLAKFVLTCKKRIKEHGQIVLVALILTRFRLWVIVDPFSVIVHTDAIENSAFPKASVFSVHTDTNRTLFPNLSPLNGVLKGIRIVSIWNALPQNLKLSQLSQS